MSKPDVIKINEVEYVRKGAEKAEKLDGMEYVIIRTYSAGVHAGYISWRVGKEVELIKSRRLWRWYGAMSLSELATEGTMRPKDCKFGCEITITLTEAIEVIPCTNKGRKSIQEVQKWEN